MNETFYIFFFFYGRLSSIDMKYHIWKLGVVFTDNVSAHLYIDKMPFI